MGKVHVGGGDVGEGEQEAPPRGVVPRLQSQRRQDQDQRLLPLLEITFLLAHEHRREPNIELGRNEEL